ncbi:MAG: TetR/AcrR family transcriptional regulator [Verrucomicrobia bacterium]|nr:TetR/AcrR family transcriptional regulator [Verrucomicrobiota bacterium]
MRSQQNRTRILAVAKEAFAKAGANASLDDIAKQAGVGPGTLYRHFPSREDLLKAVYQAAAEKLAMAATGFAETLSPVEALRAWMMLFVDYLADKQIIAPALSAWVDDPHQVYEASYGQTREAVRGLVKRAVQSGDLRADLDAVDLLRALAGVSSVGASPNWQQSARKLVDILIQGSRPNT